MESVHRELNTPYGAMVMYPPYVKHGFPGALIAAGLMSLAFQGFSGLI